MVKNTITHQKTIKLEFNNINKQDTKFKFERLSYKLRIQIRLF